MVPAPPIPENLHNRRRVLYGFRVPDGVIERYIKEKETHTIPPEFYWRRQYKWALLRSIAHDIDLPFYTRYHEVIEGCGTEPDGDMVYWSTGGYGHVLAPRVPSADKLALFAERLGLEGVEPAWH
ncbi:hypothetical protein L226DRAFT_524030 [Lentinus tigrinus ALCF2SS1-7]|uniref:Uncharacterized protein n=1 Tax=Lentinus tigrinus ALCF2SS1-6 TaxID=1328759 RepID=A0A5C2S7H5_9APHY|nr:hypothetical protein L227DRAFT_564327 [Lentinus tigrinus ALCF2SS1-6]RPD73595.1 hypothetical protein L226DRAFT_524030 [Lentinus tigrinus ALCF2SS1-7]